MTMQKKKILSLLLLAALSAAALLSYDQLDSTAATEINAHSKTVSPYVAMAKGRVDIEGGIIHLAASRDGIIKEVFVEEGERVDKGRLLALLDDQQPRLNLNLAEREVEQAQAALPALRVRLKTAQREVKRLEPLMKDQNASKQELDQAGDQVLLLQAEIKAAQAAIAVYMSRSKIAEYEVEQHAIRAPLDGSIIRRQARPGDGVSTLNVTPLFLFAPDAPRIVRADLEERFVNLVKPGMEAEVVPEADETKTFPAQVLRIGKVFGIRPPSDDPADKVDVRVVECVLSIADQSLLIGQRVLVKIKK
jgi:RND family efflux transporter MFP subunit